MMTNDERNAVLEVAATQCEVLAHRYWMDDADPQHNIVSEACDKCAVAIRELKGKP